jgi:hypothetical protein
VSRGLGESKRLPCADSDWLRKKVPSMPISANKRLKEKARQDKARDKAAQREQRKVEKDNRPQPAPGEDPDIAGIIPGPQPVVEWE